MPRRSSLPSSSSGPDEFPTVHYYRDHLKADVAARVRNGDWQRVQAGAYLRIDPDLTVHASRRRLALARIVATATLTSAYACFSHSTAALIWGLPVARVPTRTHVIQRHTPSGRPSRLMTRHVLQLPEEHRTEHRELPVTSVARTVVDCARTLSPLDALTIADGALAGGLSPDDVSEVLSHLCGLPGTHRAAKLLALADGGAESPGETRTRFELLRAGLPAAETQIEVSTHLGQFWADLGWRQWRLLIEYDGRPKYEVGASEALMKEKRRHDAIVEAGFRVLRVTKEDLRKPEALIHRVASLMPAGVINPRSTPPVLLHS